MFPNFTSLAQREQKRQELLERAQRRVRQASAKRDMYADASWSSDADKALSLTSSKITTSSQTDTSEGLKKTLSDENSNKNPEVSTSPVDVNVTPSTSSIGVNATPSVADFGVNTITPSFADMSVNAKPSVADMGVNANPSVADMSVNAKPSVADIGVNATPSVANIGVNATPSVADAETSMANTDDDDQVAAYKWIRQLFKSNPNWAALKIRPINRDTGEDDQRFFLGDNASRISIKTGRKSRVPKTGFDWIDTMDKIRTILYNGESKSIDEVSEMRLEDPLYQAELLKKWQKRMSKRERSATEEADRADRPATSKQRPNDVEPVLLNRGTATKSEQEQSKLKMFWIIYKNRELLEPIKKEIFPTLHGGLKKTIINRDVYVWIDNNSIKVFGNKSEREKPAVTETVDWHATLQALLSMAKTKGLNLVLIGKQDSDISVNSTFTPGEGEARSGVQSGRDIYMDASLTNADNNAHKILYDYYTNLLTNNVDIAFRLRPSLETKNGVKQHKTYYLGQPIEGKIFNFLNRQNKPVSGNPLRDLNKNIVWSDTFEILLESFEELENFFETSHNAVLERNLKENVKLLNNAVVANTSRVKLVTNREFENAPLRRLHDAANSAYQKYKEAMRKREEAKQALKDKPSKSVEWQLQAAASAVIAAKVVYLQKQKMYNDAYDRDFDEFKDRQTDRSGTGLVGRGLRGAGVAPLEGVVRRGRTYNLNEIQGLATPSAYTYRQLGSKYIRIPDLDHKTLVICQPNRRKCGPKRVISEKLQSVIRTLAFKQQIDQNAYDKLDIEDKKLFKEILAITHLQYNFHDRLDDPLDSLRAEYDKLKGELELGNDNPSIIKQLKVITIDMYSNRLISDKEFKDIIVRLI